MLKVIMVTCVRHENMYHDVHVVHSDPHAILQSCYLAWLLVEVYAYLVADRVGNGLYLAWLVTLADNECLCDATVYLAEVYNCNVAAFLVLNSVNGLIY